MAEVSGQKAWRQVVDNLEAELIDQQNRIIKIIPQTHTAKDTLKYVEEVQQSELNINNILLEILNPDTISDEFRLEADATCKRIRELKAYTRDMKTDLILDLYNHNRTDDKNSIDFPRNSGIAASVLFGGAAFWRTSNDAGALFGIACGLLTAAAVLYSKKIIRGFGAAAKAACHPKQTVAAAKQAINNTKLRLADFASEKKINERRFN